MNIHEYSNELIYIVEYQIKRQCLSFHLISTLSVYDEYRLRHEQVTICTVLIKFVLWVAMKTVRFHIAQMSFFLEAIFSLIQWVPVCNLASMRNGPNGRQGRLN